MRDHSTQLKIDPLESDFSPLRVPACKKEIALPSFFP
jgi:hypothetical protein